MAGQQNTTRRHATCFRRRHAAEIALKESLDTRDAAQLNVHLYNAAVLRHSIHCVGDQLPVRRQSENSIEIRPPAEGIDQARWEPPVNWTAWPSLAGSTSATGHHFEAPFDRLDAPSSLRQAALNSTTRIGFRKFLDRKACSRASKLAHFTLVHGSDDMSSVSGDDAEITKPYLSKDISGAMSPSNPPLTSTLPESLTDSEPNVPAYLADDDKAYCLLAPLLDSVQIKLDRLLQIIYLARCNTSSTTQRGHGSRSSQARILRGNRLSRTSSSSNPKRSLLGSADVLEIYRSMYPPDVLHKLILQRHHSLSLRTNTISSMRSHDGLNLDAIERHQDQVLRFANDGFLTKIPTRRAWKDHEKLPLPPPLEPGSP